MTVFEFTGFVTGDGNGPLNSTRGLSFVVRSEFPGFGAGDGGGEGEGEGEGACSTLLWPDNIRSGDFSANEGRLESCPTITCVSA